jgi:hypothetical protein
MIDGLNEILLPADLLIRKPIMTSLRVLEKRNRLAES